MTTVVLGERPAELDQWLDRRRSLGQDRYDEVWEGELHVVPGPSIEHAQVDGDLFFALRSRAQFVRLAASTAFNLGEPGNYRVPDGGLHRTRASGVYVATAAAVVEVLSLNDETFAKFGFYADHGVEEVFVADPAGGSVRIWQLRSGGAGAPSYEETGRSELLDVDAATLTDEVTWP